MSYYNLKPYKVYVKGKLNDVVYFKTGTTLKSVKESLLGSGYPANIVIKHLIRGK